MSIRAGGKRAATEAVIGLARGDVLGFPPEFNDVPQILPKCGSWQMMELPRPAFITDDTQMTLALGRGPLAPLRVVRPVREEFVEWWRSPDNNRAPGRTCLVACERLGHDGLRWQEASQIGPKGCGANMRVAPVALVPGLAEETRAGVAQLQSALTHGHPSALAASGLTARAVYLVARGARPGELVASLRGYALANRSVYRERWLGDLWEFAQDHSALEFCERGWDECLAALDRLNAALRDADPHTDPCLATGAGWIAEQALGTALLCFLLFPDEPVTAVRRAACTSGDSDSIACLPGAFAGAYLGADAWPREWADRIEYREELLALGQRWDGD